VKDIELNTWTFNKPAQLAFQKLGLASRNVRFGLTTGAGQQVSVQPEIAAGGASPRR